MIDLFRRAVRGVMRRVARDETLRAGQGSALVVAPHPDDETLGCGATIMRKRTADAPVTVLVVTDGRHSHASPYLPPGDLAQLRRAEMAEAAARLGLSPDAVRWAGFVDGTLTEREDELVDLLVDLITTVRPDELYVTPADESHPDHAALGRAGRRAVARTDQPPRLLEYPVWLWAAWPLRRGARMRSMLDAGRVILRRRVIRVATAPYLPDKLHALQAHGSQVGRPGPVPEHAEWAVLPDAVLEAAADTVELFLTAG
jgi:LmbE family N-acetylglucosaminyl deacetylase